MLVFTPLLQLPLTTRRWSFSGLGTEYTREPELGGQATEVDSTTSTDIVTQGKRQ